MESIPVWQWSDDYDQLDEHLHLPQETDTSLQRHNCPSRSTSWEASMLRAHQIVHSDTLEIRQILYHRVNRIAVLRLSKTIMQ